MKTGTMGTARRRIIDMYGLPTNPTTNSTAPTTTTTSTIKFFPSDAAGKATATATTSRNFIDENQNRLCAGDMSVTSHKKAARTPESHLSVLQVNASSTDSMETNLYDFTGTVHLSKFLLRVNDLQIVVDKDQGYSTERLLYMDLGEKCLNHELLNQVLDRMVETGLSLLSNNHTVRLPSVPAQSRFFPPIEWKTEGLTEQLLRRCAQMPALDRVSLLSKEILMWSGQFQGKCPGQELPLLLARGLVPQSPRAMMEMLWDNGRTCEYNNFSMGRTTVLSLQDNRLDCDDNLDPANAFDGDSKHNVDASTWHTSTKVARSETRVPMTKMTVNAFVLMHVRPLPGGPEEGYVIISRTLDNERSGQHTAFAGESTECRGNASKNGVLWGINIFRRIANHPDSTDLICLSQVETSMIPKFIRKKIGFMSIEDFFKNVRRSKNCVK